MELFDCNCSYGRAARPPYRFAADVAELAAELDECGIDRALVYHTNMRFASPTTWNEVCSAELVGHPRLAATWAILPPSCGELPPPADLVARMKAHGVRALRAFPQEHRYRLDRATLGDLLPLLVERRIPLFAKENLYALKELLTECPELIVVAVNQGPHSLERHLRPLLDRFPSLYLETSYLLVEGLLEEFCTRYGPERLLFGSGFPDNCSGAALLRLAAADLSEDCRRAIAAGNLTRLLGEVRL